MEVHPVSGWRCTICGKRYWFDVEDLDIDELEDIFPPEYV